MYVLGINCGHNSTAVLIKDGKVIACASEERFVGIKNIAGFPKNAIDYVLKEANINTQSLGMVTIGLEYTVPNYAFESAKENLSTIFFISIYPIVNLIRSTWGLVMFHFPATRRIGKFFYRRIGYPVGKINFEKEKNTIADYLKISRKIVKGYNHHLSHAASAYYASPFNKKRALVLTMDGEGDFSSASVNIFEGNNWEVISTTDREDSFGWLFLCLTDYLGMKAGEHEYKVMGLAPYAKNEDVQALYRKIEHIITIDKKSLKIRAAFNTMDTERFLSKKMKKVRFDLLAGVFQKLLEEKVTLWVREAIKKTGINTVILAGGVFMNVKLNQKIGELKEVKEFFVIPTCGDETSMLGSSYLGYIEWCNSNNIIAKIPQIKDIYWGLSYTNNDVEKFLSKNNILKKYNVTKIKNIEKEIAKLLTKGIVVARVCGRMEFGARALGNRSILADPRNVDVVKIINEQIKNRDFWMPFAPSILYEKQDKYIENPKRFSADYMMMSFNTTEKGREELKAAMHQYDYTVRPQLVRRDFNPSYYKLLSEFEKITGVSGLLNTSFNLHGYPIVLGPKEALFVFKNSGITHLALENYLIVKK